MSYREALGYALQLDDPQQGLLPLTDTPDAVLVKWANKGWLECTHYEVTDLGRNVLEEYRAARTRGEKGGV